MCQFGIGEKKAWMAKDQLCGETRQDNPTPECEASDTDLLVVIPCIT